MLLIEELRREVGKENVRFFDNGKILTKLIKEGELENIIGVSS